MSSMRSSLVERVSKRHANRGAHRYAQKAVALRTIVWPHCCRVTGHPKVTGRTIRAKFGLSNFGFLETFPDIQTSIGVFQRAVASRLVDLLSAVLQLRKES